VLLHVAVHTLSEDIEVTFSSAEEGARRFTLGVLAHRTLRQTAKQSEGLRHRQFR
jgi:hypothetical protein